MKFKKVEHLDKLGRKIIIRSPKIKDADKMLAYLNKTAKETKFLLREEEETHLSIQSEEKFLASIINDERQLMLVAEYEGEIIGSSSFSPVSSLSRIKHRASMGIAIYKDFIGQGIGSAMLKILLEEAKKAGYSQMELEVVTTNQNAVALYKKMGFNIYGTMPNNIRYKDETYADCYWMMKKL